MSLSELRRQLARELVTFLDNTFTEKLGEPAEWWNTHVVQQLSYGQKGHLRAKGIDRLGQLDLHALLRIFDRNWAEISYWCSVSNEVRTLGKGITDQRHNTAHEAAELTEDDPSDLYRDIDTLVRFSEALDFSDELLKTLADARQHALVAMASSAMPEMVNVEPAAAKEPALVSSEQADYTAQDEEPAPEDPAARVLGSLRIHGPEDSIATEIAAFSGNAVPATEIPWRVTGPGGLEFKINICLIDDPEEDGEIGQVMCDSRMTSPQGWDEVVRRLRIGIRQVDDGNLCMDLRTAEPKPDNRATRKVKPLAELSEITGINVANELTRLGACNVGTRADLTGETNKTRNWPCVVFEADDILTPVAAWAAVTVLPLIGKL